MNKKFFSIIAAVFIIVAVAVNASMSFNNKVQTGITLANVEALANDETHGGYNSFWDMFKYGLTKDERSEYVKCSNTSGFSINIGIWSYDNKTTIYGYKWECYDGGFNNCDSTPCS